MIYVIIPMGDQGVSGKLQISFEPFWRSFRHLLNFRISGFIVLYGSAAQGEKYPWSDIDIVYQTRQEWEFF